MVEGFVDYLDILDKCLVCPKVRQAGRNGFVPHKDQITVEHIFPRSMRRSHPEILREIIDARMNHVIVCREHHDIIERAKAEAYKGQNFVGLTTYVCELYPRSIHPELLELQGVQWGMLIGEVRNNILKLNGNVAPHLMSGYSMASDLIERHLSRWGRYGFS